MEDRFEKTRNEPKEKNDKLKGVSNEPTEEVSELEDRVERGMRSIIATMFIVASSTIILKILFDLSVDDSLSILMHSTVVIIGCKVLLTNILKNVKEIK